MRHLDLVTLVRDADNAMYSAKALGRDQVYVFHEIQDDGPIKRAAIAPSARERAVEVGRAAMGAATDSLTAALGERSGWTGKPSTMIASAATELGRAVGLPEPELERIRVASLLHDLGKLAIPEEILTKPGELNDPEWRIVSEHPKIGQVILEQAGALRDAATIVLHHHEWFDGRGYPHGLSGGDIPIGARIVASPAPTRRWSPAVRTAPPSPTPKRSPSCAATRASSSTPSSWSCSPTCSPPRCPFRSRRSAASTMTTGTRTRTSTPGPSTSAPTARSTTISTIAAGGSRSR